MKRLLEVQDVERCKIPTDCRLQEVIEIVARDVENAKKLLNTFVWILTEKCCCLRVSVPG